MSHALPPPLPLPLQLQQELADEAAAAAVGAVQIKELNELNVKLSGHNNQQQVGGCVMCDV